MVHPASIMRFHADGPNIPNELLDSRDNGNVVFFCGAGVSMPASLPSFISLAKNVIAELGVPADAASRRLLEKALNGEDPGLSPPMDQVFGLLQREYGASQVERAVVRNLRTPRNADTSFHETVLRLSTGNLGKTQLVTTNFDLLFEKAQRGMRRYVPPGLPDLSRGQALDGLVYLHGRAGGQRSVENRVQGLILGSGDFGRAYLADGWATQFVRELIGRYTVVLLGYSADDPPVRYLLEGLHNRPANPPNKLYAFAEGEVGTAGVRWRERGVNAITYVKSDSSHSNLWNTLRAWARRADSPQHWRSEMVQLARKGPRAMGPHQRGQIAALVGSPVGARAFADAEPPPTAEWLCVFDSFLRYALPQKDLRNMEREPFDPLEAYGLDDDPQRPVSNRRDFVPPGIDLIAPISPEERGPNQIRLAGALADQPEPLPSRLRYLAWWISKVAYQPTAVWWAAGKTALNRRVQDLVEWSVGRNELACSPVVLKAWRLLFEALDHAPKEHRGDWYDLLPWIRLEGWTKTNLREFERVVRPYLKISRPAHGAFPVPEQATDELTLRTVINCEVECIGPLGEIPDIADHVLPAVTAAVRKGLEHAASLRNDLSEISWRLPTLHPTDAPGNQYVSDCDAYFLWFSRLFSQLCNANIQSARREFAAWPEHEPFYFDKLRIWAWMKSEIAGAAEVAKGILALSDETFWNSYLQREFLWTLRARWPETGARYRRAIEDRIIAGPQQWPNEDDKDYVGRRGSEAAVRLGWLQLNGCDLSTKAVDELPRLRDADADWRESWDRNADHAYEVRGGSVRIEADPGKLIDTPISEVISLARQETKRVSGELVEYAPFKGLVETRPSRALAALMFEGRRGNFPTAFWETIISTWPDAASERATWVFANRLSRLPEAVLSSLRHYLPRWLRQHLPDLMRNNKRDVWAVWDAVYDALAELGEEVMASSIGDTAIFGSPKKLSRRTLDHAINSPVGILTECLIICLDSLKLGRNAGMPIPIKRRIEQAIAAPGKGGDYAVAVLCRQLQFLYAIDPAWVAEILTPMFDLKHRFSEPAWSGFLYNSRLPTEDLFVSIKSAFLAAFTDTLSWEWEDRASKRLAEFLVVATVPKERAYLGFDEARSALQSTDDSGRRAALWQLLTMTDGERGWIRLGRPFLEKAWPKEVKFQTSATSQILAEIAIRVGRHFPTAVRMIQPFLCSVNEASTLVYSITKDQADGSQPLATLFPTEALELLDRLIADEPRTLPHGLNAALDALAEAAPALRQDPRWQRLNDLLVGP